MNINDPTISRILAVLIQPVLFEDRSKFIENAEKAPNMESFIRGINRYKTILLRHRPGGTFPCALRDFSYGAEGKTWWPSSQVTKEQCHNSHQKNS